MNVIMFFKYDEEEVGQRWKSAGRRWIIIIECTIMGFVYLGSFAHAMHVAFCWICLPFMSFVLLLLNRYSLKAINDQWRGWMEGMGGEYKFNGKKEHGWYGGGGGGGGGGG